MEEVMNYIIGGVIALLVLFSLAPTVLDQYGTLGNEVDPETTETTTYFDLAPGGVEAAVGAVLVIFFVLILWTFYQNVEK